MKAPGRKSAKRRTSNSTAIAVPSDDRESISIRKISNGFIISRSGQKRGKYFEHQEYSPGKPTVTANVSKPSRPVKGT